MTGADGVTDGFVKCALCLGDKRIALEAPDKGRVVLTACDRCRGTGQEPTKTKRCSACAGHTRLPLRDETTRRIKMEECPVCVGTGREPHWPKE